jgi:hypothetical protein
VHAKPVAVTCKLAELFAGTGSDPVSDTDTEFVFAPGDVGAITTINTTLAPALNAPTAHETDVFDPEQLPDDAEDANRTPAGSESATDTPAASTAPKFVTVTLNANGSPTCTGLGNPTIGVDVTDKSGTCGAAGVTALDGADAGPVPTTLVAATVNV